MIPRSEIRISGIDEVSEVWAPIFQAEAALAHAKTYPSRADEYGGFAAILERGHRVTGAQYAAAHLVRLSFQRKLAAVLSEVDLILCPALMAPPPPADLMEQPPRRDREMGGRVMRFTAPYDMSGSPSITLPCGFSEEGLPIGLQLVGRHLDEELLCRAGHAYEQATDWHDRHPDVG